MAAADGPYHHASVLWLGAVAAATALVWVLPRRLLVVRAAGASALLLVAASTAAPRLGDAYVTGSWLATLLVAESLRSRVHDRRPLGLLPTLVTLIAVGLWAFDAPAPLVLATGAAAAGTLVASRLRPASWEPVDSALERAGDRAAEHLVGATVAISTLAAGAAAAALRSLGRGAARAATRVARSSASTWRAERPAIVAAALLVLGTLPLFAALTHDVDRPAGGFTDFPTHMEAVDLTSLLPFTTLTPHWAFHAAAAGARPFVGPEWGAALVLALSMGALALIIDRQLRQPAEGAGAAVGPVAAATASVVIVLAESPTALLNALGVLDPARAFVPLHAWGNPTDTFALPLLLGLLIATVRFAGEPDLPWRQPTSARWWLLGLGVAATIAKPNVPMVLLGVLPLFVWIRGSRSLRRLATVAAWFIVPVIAVLVLQFRHMRTSDKIAAYDPGGWGVTIDPLSFTELWPAGQGGAWFWSTVLVVVLGAVGFRSGIHRDPLVLVTGLTLLASLPPLLLLRETGLRASDGNFMKAAFNSTVLMALVLMIHIARAALGRGADGSRRPMGWAQVATIGVGVVMALAGLAVYVDAIAPGALPGPVWPAPEA